jgi:hypothetical protein
VLDGSLKSHIDKVKWCQAHEVCHVLTVAERVFESDSAPIAKSVGSYLNYFTSRSDGVADTERLLHCVAMTTLAELERHPWDAADELRANSRVNPYEYSASVLDLIFLRYSYLRFEAVRQRLVPTISGELDEYALGSELLKAVA